MGNHFRTSGAGDKAPKTQPSVPGSRFATPDSEDQLLSPIPAQPADQAQPAADPLAYNPNNDVALSGTAGFEPVQTVTARVAQPQSSAATPQPTMAGIPDPMAPAAPAPQPAQSGFLPAFRPHAACGSRGRARSGRRGRKPRQRAQQPRLHVGVCAHRPAGQPQKMAKQAGVEPVILMEHVTKIYPAQPNKPALDDINIEIYPGEFVFLVGHSGSGKTTLLRRSTATSSPPAAAFWSPARIS